MSAFSTILRYSGTISNAAAVRQTGLLPQAMLDHLNEHGRLEIPGLGIFKMKNRAQRRGRNPQTGETITIPASRTIIFRLAKEMKERL